MIKNGYKKWHPDRTPLTSVNLVVGPRGAGKTTFVTSALKYETGLARGYLICPTPEAWNTWTNYFPPVYMFQIFDSAFEDKEKTINAMQETTHLQIQAKMTAIKRKMEEWAEEMNANEYKELEEKFWNMSRSENWSKHVIEKNLKEFQEQWKVTTEQRMSLRKADYDKQKREMVRPHVILSVFDDLGFDKKAMRSPVINQACMNGRHYLKKLYVLCQQFMQFNSDNRDAVDWLMVSPKLTQPNFKRFFEHYMSNIKKDDLQSIVDEFAKNDWWMCIDRRCKSADPKDYIYWYQPDFTIITKTWMGDELYQYVQRATFAPEKVAASREIFDQYYAELQDGGGGGERKKKLTGKKKKEEEKKRALAQESKKEEQELKSNQAALMFANIGPEEESKFMINLIKKEQTMRSRKHESILAKLSVKK